jgi:cell division protein FtsI/penicillin-binding protein 2
MTDTFEPGSTMKPITVAMALEAGRVKPQTMIDTGPGALQHRRLHDQRHAQLRHADGRRRDPEVQQRR